MFSNIVEKRASSLGESFLLKKSKQYLSPVQSLLGSQLDRRLVQTFYDVFMSILLFRERHMGLLLSELGGYILGHDRAPAGTKRISNLLRSLKWGGSLIDDYLFAKSKERIAKMQVEQRRPLLLWDESVVEKPESWSLQGLCSVFSSKGQRLTRIKPGFYEPPKGRIYVPGYRWCAVMLSGLGDIPSVCHMAWWTDKGKFKEWGTNIIYRMLRKLDQQVGRVALHVFDRGYANATMLEWLFHFKQDFLIRWKSNLLLTNQLGLTKQTHRLARSYVSTRPKIVFDKERKVYKRVSVAWGIVHHPDFEDQQLYLLIIRDQTFKTSPMYLVTNDSIENSRDAWKLCFAYFHRWNVEQAFRFSKAELGIEAPRLWFWENRLKFLAILTLVFDFLLQMVRNWRGWVFLFIQKWGKRTGNKLKNVKNPIYRLRAAISRCLDMIWHKHQFS